MAGWLFMALGAFSFGLTNLALISLPFAPVILLRAGVLIEALLLSYGLADQLKTLNDKAQRAQQRLLESTQQRLEETRELARAEQAKKEAELDLLQKDLDIARARHDIRQPIHSLRMALLATQKQQGESASFEVINRALDHMEALLSSEQLSGTESRPATDQVISYGDLLRQLAAEFSAEADSIEIEIRCRYSSIPITTSTVSLKRAISNLLANALRHSEASRVLVGIRRRAEGVELMVADNGCGLTASDGESAGDGLGLGIVETLCQQHGWKLSSSSEEGFGTCFKIAVQYGGA